MLLSTFSRPYRQLKRNDGPGSFIPIMLQLGMHLTQVAPTDCDLLRGNLEGLAMWA